jgi:hypothetical protein
MAIWAGTTDRQRLKLRKVKRVAIPASLRRHPYYSDGVSCAPGRSWGSAWSGHYFAAGNPRSARSLSSAAYMVDRSRCKVARLTFVTRSACMSDRWETSDWAS